MGMFKAIKERKLAPATIIVFSYLFLPMLVSFNSYQGIMESGSSVNEQDSVEEIDPMAGIQSFRVLSRFDQSIERPNFLNYSRAVLPVDNPEVSSDYGWRAAPCKACSSDHKGVDFIPGEGEPVFAVLNGIVVASGKNQGYGYWVKLEHVVQKTPPLLSAGKPFTLTYRRARYRLTCL